MKLAVFDWNGTLLADTKACMDADNHVIETFGGEPVDLKQYREIADIPAIDFYAQCGCDRQELLKDTERVGEVFHTFYEPRAANCRSRKGARKVLKWLESNSKESVILSNHTVEGIEYQLQRLKFADYISHVIANSARDSSMKQRNKLQKLQEYMNLHNYEPSETAIIDDAPEGIEIGKTLGLTTIAIIGGYYSTSRLRARKPDYLINSLTELIGIFESPIYS